MKKFLSLVLALIMTMSLVTVGAGAAYTDADKVNYAEAIDVMSAVGVISGYEDGSINPQGALTRGAAAKIICNLVLGPTDANALVVNEAPYKDVPANSTYAGYISYCKSAGYVSGYADGTFKPGAPLTGYAFMKMLLGTLGLDATIEEYVGTNWSINVAKRALNLGLDDGLKGSFNGTKVVNREEAMLFAFNTLQATKFHYQDKGSNITVGGVTINTGASEATQASQPILYVDLFGTKLVPTETVDDFGRPATQWTYKGKKVGTYVDEPTVSYTKKVELKTIYGDLGLASDTPYDYYDNYSNSLSTYTLTKSSTTKIGEAGVKLEVFKDEDGAVKSIVRIDPYFAKVTEVAKDDDGRYILTATGDKMHTEEFAKNDYIVYTKSGADSKIQTAYAVEKQTGTVTKKVGSDTYVIDGTSYDCTGSAYISEGSANVKDTVDFWVDENGYIVKIDATSSTATIDNVAVMVEAGKDRGQDWAKALFVGDKKAKIVDTTNNLDLTDSGSSNSATYYANKLVKYTLDGENYKMETVGDYYAGAYAFTNGTASLYIDSSMSFKLDGKTTFMYIDSEGAATYYTGIKNAPTFTTCSGVSVLGKSTDLTTAALVVVHQGNAATNSNDLIFVIRNKSADKVDEGDGKSYYTFNTVKGTTLDVDGTSFDNIFAASTYDNGIAVIKSYTTNSKGVSTTTDATPNTDYYRCDLTTEVVNGVITLDNTYTLPVAEDCVVYLVSKDGKTVTPTDVEAIVEQGASMLYYNEIVATWNKDGEVDVIVLASKN